MAELLSRQESYTADSGVSEIRVRLRATVWHWERVMESQATARREFVVETRAPIEAA